MLVFINVLRFYVFTLYTRDPVGMDIIRFQLPSLTTYIQISYDINLQFLLFYQLGKEIQPNITNLV